MSGTIDNINFKQPTLDDCHEYITTHLTPLLKSWETKQKTESNEVYDNFVNSPIVTTLQNDIIMLNQQNTDLLKRIIILEQALNSHETPNITLEITERVYENNDDTPIPEPSVPRGVVVWGGRIDIERDSYCGNDECSSLSCSCDDDLEAYKEHAPLLGCRPNSIDAEEEEDAESEDAESEEEEEEEVESEASGIPECSPLICAGWTVWGGVKGGYKVNITTGSGSPISPFSIKTYFVTNEQNGDIFNINENNEIGDKIGNYKNGIPNIF